MQPAIAQLAVVLAAIPPPPPPSVAQFNTVFPNMSSNGPADNMPVGNGEVVANVWVDEMHGGSLGLLLGRSDVFTGWAQPLKLGRLRVLLEPNPFLAPPSPPPPCINPANKTASYVQYNGLIGDQNHFSNGDFPCSSLEACPDEAKDKCNATVGCRGVAFNPNWKRAGQIAAAQLYTDGIEGASPNADWTFWSSVAQFSEHLNLFQPANSTLNGRFPCSSHETCPTEAAEECMKLPDCRSFAVSPPWGMAAQLFSTGLKSAVPNNDWFLYVRPCEETSSASTATAAPVFTEELHLENGTVTVRASANGVTVNLTVWSDVTSPDLDGLYVEVSASVPVNVTVAIDSWRTTTIQQPTSGTARGPCNHTVPVEPDSFLPSTTPNDVIGWYRRNKDSTFTGTMTTQMLGKLAATMTDPLLGRASGAVVKGTTAGSAPFARLNATVLRSTTAGTAHTVMVVTATELASPSAESFTAGLLKSVAAMKAPDQRREGHEAWWSDFHNRSWIVVSPGNASVDSATTEGLSQAYTLTRYLSAIQSQGALPIHHNGGTLTWGWNGTSTANPDERPWGGGFWFQNTRMMYWYMLAAGDWDLLAPLFSMYLGQLPVLQGRSKAWWNHSGSSFGETSYFWGTYEDVDYGCGRFNLPDITNPYIKHHYEGLPELATIMLEAYAHTRDDDLLQHTVLPWCESLATFYDKHYPTLDNGTLYLQHAQSCETWPDCDNPAAQVAALHRVFEMLTALPAKATTPTQRALFRKVGAALPTIPLTTTAHGEPTISPCLGGFPSHHVNSENTETYPIWPYGFFSVNRSSEAQYPHKIGLTTFDNVHFGHGNSAWRYDGMDAAYLGMAQYALGFSTARVFDQGRTDGSRFPGYLSKDPSDGAPEVESNGIVALTLQKMLLQVDGDRILLFPAWPAQLDVDAKLHIPSHGGKPSATLRVVASNGKVTTLDVDPVSREADIVQLPWQD